MQANQPLTTEQLRRINEALTETHRLLAKELSYRVDLQNHAVIIFYRGHIAKLKAMADQEAAPPVWNAESARRRVGGTFGT